MSALKWLGKNCPYRSSVELHSGVAVIVRVEYTLPQAMPKSKPWRRDLGQAHVVPPRSNLRQAAIFKARRAA